MKNNLHTDLCINLFQDEDAVIQEFFKTDACSQLADKYLLAMVFTYFKRAQYAPQEFTRYNFFVAL
jgi:speedy protein